MKALVIVDEISIVEGPLSVVTHQNWRLRKFISFHKTVALVNEDTLEHAPNLGILCHFIKLHNLPLSNYPVSIVISLTFDSKILVVNDVFYDLVEGVQPVHELVIHVYVDLLREINERVFEKFGEWGLRIDLALASWYQDVLLFLLKWEIRITQVNVGSSLVEVIIVNGDGFAQDILFEVVEVFENASSILENDVDELFGQRRNRNEFIVFIY